MYYIKLSQRDNKLFIRHNSGVEKPATIDDENNSSHNRTGIRTKTHQAVMV